MLFAVLTLGISTAALIVATWSAISQSRAAKREGAIQERLLRLEQAREQYRAREAEAASVTAGVEASGEETWLVVRNRGLGSADEVRVLVDGVPIHQHEIVFCRAEQVTQLGPGAEVRYPLAITFGTNHLVDVQITWSDATGGARRWQSQLTLY
jgi:hypothetical protein